MSFLTRFARTAALEAAVSLWGGSALRLRSLDQRQPEGRNPSRDDEIHLRAALQWIGRAQDVGSDDGVAAMFACLQGWQGSYPETTGYIIPTLYRAADDLEEYEWRSRARRMADWLLTRQFDDGAFPGLFDGRPAEPRVFNTGQILFGLLRAFEDAGDERYLDAARRAGDWLAAQQDEDGCWRRHTYNGIPHTYNTRTAWALARLGQVTGDDPYTCSARQNAQWAMAQQDTNGWFRHNAFATDRSVFLHTIAYAARGLLEIGDLLGETSCIRSARAAAVQLHEHWQREGRIPGAFREGWRHPADWICVPGCAQLVLVWLRLDEIEHRRHFRASAFALLEQVKASQLMHERNPDLHGGVTGSFPVNGDYERYCVVNWGAKFLADAILLKRRILREERRRERQLRRYGVIDLEHDLDEARNGDSQDTDTRVTVNV